MKTTKTLKIGYTTGTHATSALKVALLALLSGQTDFKTIDVELPDKSMVELPVESIDYRNNCVRICVVKGYNDDIDATKNCKIICWAGVDREKIPYNPTLIEHEPYKIVFKNMLINIFAGKGLGVTTKDGLQVPKGFPAINPVPLSMMQTAINQVLNKIDLTSLSYKEMFVIFEVENGEEISKDTANEKVGIKGGISFLGKLGIVKPISSEAYLAAMNEEISIASNSPSKTIILTIGNSAFKFAGLNFNLNQECFVEIGNYIYDSLRIISNYNFEKIIIISNIGKLTKIAQNKKNTDNRKGEIDFNEIEQWLTETNFPVSIRLVAKTSNTTLMLEEYINREFPDYMDKYYTLLLGKSLTNINNWFEEFTTIKPQIKIILTDGTKAKSMIETT